MPDFQRPTISTPVGTTFPDLAEGLKKQGVKNSVYIYPALLNEEQNPNANVELLPFAHFMD